jgi:hypothetical protein
MRKSKTRRGTEQTGLADAGAGQQHLDYRRAQGRGGEREADSLADLSRYLKEKGDFKLAASAEFIERPDALPAFEKAYDFKLDQAQLLSLAGGIRR